MAKVYSPSSTTTWTRCPMMRALGREGWQPKHLIKKDFSALLGQGFAAGVGIYNNLRQEWERAGAQAPQRDLAHRKDLVDACADPAWAIVKQKLEEIDGYGFTDRDETGADYRAKLEIRIRKALAAYIVTDPIDDNCSIVAAEYDFGPEYGNSRLDLLIKNPAGKLVVIDYKSKLTLAAQYRAKTVSEYANSHQMFHYSWATSEVFGEAVDSYAIGLAILEPRWAFDLLPFPVHPESLQVWLASARTIWANIEREELGDAVPWMSPNHADNFGQCPYYRACFTHHYDPALMAADYVKTEAR